jgi:hypothetical protein
MSLTVATRIGAIAMVILAVGAGFTVYYARKAFREQSEELEAQRAGLDSNVSKDCEL